MSQKFFRACITGQNDIVTAYLDNGTDPNVRDQFMFTGLIWAGRKGQIEVADLLIQRGAVIEATDIRGRTALFHAVTEKRYDMVVFLVKSNANINPIDQYVWTPLDFSRSSRNVKMTALLEHLGAVGNSTV